MSTTTILLIIAGIAAYIVYMVYAFKKSKQMLGKYDNPEGYKQAPEIKDAFINGRFAAISKQMQGAPVDAFTQCAYITTMADKAKSAAATAAKTVAWAAVGVKAKYQQADHAAYLVLSGDELHYIFFEEAEAKEHLVFDKMRLLAANVAEVTGTEKVARMGSVIGRNNHKLNIDIDGRRVDIIFYDKVERYPETVLAFEKNARDTFGKFKLMGTYFKNQLFDKYPHLSN